MDLFAEEIEFDSASRSNMMCEELDKTYTFARMKGEAIFYQHDENKNKSESYSGLNDYLSNFFAGGALSSCLEVRLDRSYEYFGDESENNTRMEREEIDKQTDLCFSDNREETLGTNSVYNTPSDSETDSFISMHEETTIKKPISEKKANKQVKVKGKSLQCEKKASKTTATKRIKKEVPKVKAAKNNSAKSSPKRASPVSFSETRSTKFELSTPTSMCEHERVSNTQQKRPSPSGSRRGASRTSDLSDNQMENFKEVIYESYGIKRASNEALMSIFNDQVTREIVTIANQTRAIPATFGKFCEMVKKDMNVTNGCKRKDEYQKKAFSKCFFGKYLTVFKKHSKYPKEKALQDMREHYGMTSPETQDAFDRIFGGGRKYGINNSAVKEILTNDLILSDLLSEEYLVATLETMNDQTEEDIRTNLLEKFKLGPLGLLNEMRVEQIDDEDADHAPGKKQSFKLPWSLSQNIQALILMLEKFSYRARKEELTAQVKLLQNRIAYFNNMLH